MTVCLLYLFKLYYITTIWILILTYLCVDDPEKKGQYEVKEDDETEGSPDGWHDAAANRLILGQWHTTWHCTSAQTKYHIKHITEFRHPHWKKYPHVILSRIIFIIITTVFYCFTVQKTFFIKSDMRHENTGQSQSHWNCNSWMWTL